MRFPVSLLVLSLTLSGCRCGQQLQTVEPARLGFAEFYMRRIAYRAGRISRNDYLWHLNRALLENAQSTVRHAPNARIFSEFSTSDEMSRLPYLRGQFVAMLVVGEMRKASAGAKSLDDLVRLLAERVRQTGMGVNTESVLQAIGEATSPTFEQQIRSIVLSGQELTLPPDTLSPCMTLKELRVEEGDGLDHGPMVAPAFEFMQTLTGRNACSSML